MHAIIFRNGADYPRSSSSLISAMIVFGILLMVMGPVGCGQQSRDSIVPAATLTGTAFIQDIESPETIPASLGLPDVVGVVDQALPSVVSVITTVEQTDIFGRSHQGVSTGSGVIFDARGYILTNNHVVDGGTIFEVTFHDEPKQSWPVTVVGTDSLTDLAILLLEPESVPFPLNVTKFGDAGRLKVGEWVVAIGSPLGFSGTVTLGIVSAKNRSLSVGNLTLIDLIQTDALINPGNSGGPLLNLRGEIVGINTLKVPGSTRGGLEAEGLGFAISSTMASLVATQMINDGEVAWPILGVTVSENDPAKSVEMGFDVDYGVLIEKILIDGPAHRIGMKSGDLIVALDNKQVETVNHLIHELRLRYQVGDSVTVTVIRESNEMIFQAVLDKRNF
jgi:serine protease Do